MTRIRALSKSSTANRTKKMAIMYRRGISLADIGRIFGGISRQRVFEILEKAGVLQERKKYLHKVKTSLDNVKG